MSSRLNQIKLSIIADKSQVTIFNTSGKLIESCDTLIPVDTELSVYEQFDFLKSLEELIPALPLNEKLHFGAIEWEEKAQGLFSIDLERINESTIQWLIQDNSADRTETQKVQQERNEATIGEEFQAIQRKYLEMEKELLQYKNDELHRIQAFKTQFFAEVSHEMRTPLNSISGLINLLQEGPQSRKIEYLKALSATSSHLNAIINDILDLSKVEAGKLALDNKPFFLKETLDNVVTGFSHMVQEKGLRLNLSIDKDVPKSLIGDSVRLSQIVYNLLGNALKFTAKGQVDLSIINLSESEKECELGIKVEDSGKGMSAESIKKILEPYGQAEGQDHGQYGGTGLGMGIAKALVELMGGKLSIQSIEGEGSKVAFSIHVDKGQEPAGQLNEEREDLSALSLLVAEDDPVSQMVLKESLAQYNIKSPTIVSTKQELRAHLESTKFDAVLSDLNLSDGNALDALLEFPSQELPPIIFLSGDTSEKPEALGTYSNWQFLLKPVDINILGSLLRAIVPISTIDLSNLRVATHQNVGLMKELIQIILETLPLELEKIADAIEKGSFGIAKKGLHKIGPSVSYLGNKELIESRSFLYDQLEADENALVEYRQFSTKVIAALAELKGIEI
ncbi:hybrid sensor histidine kinase/response regulator [Roseivirga sp.]|uniref:hybrid sensor histidine kinase/response regulator n=1 Tax=Roseivirga sp. TaxID=1964215 RepID=UPI003B8B6949